MRFRTRLLTTLLLTSGWLPSVGGQPANKPLEAELIAADRHIWEAISGPHPLMEKVNTALALDYLDIDGGETHSRRDVFDFLKTLTNFSFQYTSARAYLLAPTAGYVVSELTYHSTSDGKPASGRVLATTVFSKVDGQWLAHLHTEMEVPPKKP